jgi:hypothetical protein
MALNLGNLRLPIVLIGEIGLSSFLLIFPTEAALLNGSFENGFTGWTTGGVTSIQNASFGVTPTDGNDQILITNAAGSPPVGLGGEDLEEFLGVPSGIFNDLTLGTALQGSAIRQDFFVGVGDTLTLDWNFLTNDLINDDYAFVLFSRINQLSTLTNADLIKLNRNNSALFNSPSRFALESGYQSLDLTSAITSSGNYRLAIGVIDVNSVFGESGVLVDNVTQTIPISSVPEPSTLFGLFSLGTLLIIKELS